MMRLGGLRPFERQVYHRARRPDRFQRLQGRAQDRQVRRTITRAPDVLAKGVFDTAAVRSGMFDRQMVLKPAASISRCASPTDQQQIGQLGTRTTTSTRSSLSCCTMAGILSRSIASGCNK
jgi:hypothetical protein